MIAVSNVRWRSFGALARTSPASRYAHDGRRACLASYPEARLLHRVVKMLGPAEPVHISSYSQHCDVAGDHPADDVYTSVSRTSVAIGGQADSKFGVKPLMPLRPLNFRHVGR